MSDDQLPRETAADTVHIASCSTTANLDYLAEEEGAIETASDAQRKNWLDHARSYKIGEDLEPEQIFRLDRLLEQNRDSFIIPGRAAGPRPRTGTSHRH